MTNLEKLRQKVDIENATMEAIYYMCASLSMKNTDLPIYDCNVCGYKNGNCDNNDTCYNTFLSWCDRESE